jgi:hypothetical protein
MTSEVVSRVRYFPGQFLRTPDFTDEQRYHLAMRRRHNIGHHTFGIVSGLVVSLLDGLPTVEPGMAIDGYGRELILVSRTPLDMPAAFTARGTGILDVWISYQLVPAERAPTGYASCTEDDTTYRVVEQPVLRYTVPDLDRPDRRKPATVPEGDVNFGPDRTPPDDPIEDWPVFLATVTRNPDGTFQVNSDGRPYAGLVGEAIRAASGRAWIQVGAERTDDPFRFAVRIDGVPFPDIPRLCVRDDGDVEVAGKTTLVGNVEVGGGVEFAVDRTVAKLEDVPPQPWTLSRVADTLGHNEMRLEMDGPAGTVGHEVVIGTWKEPADPSAQEQFVPCLTIGSDRTVTVHGDLVVEGTLLDGARAPMQWSDSARAVLNTAFLSGVGGASAVLRRFYRSPFVTPQILIRPPDDAVEAVAQVAGDEQLLTEFATQLKTRAPAAAEALRAALRPGT